MTFTAVTMKGEPAIYADGPIVAGDADRLKRVLIPQNMHSAGYYPVLLNSPGGSVLAAFEISSVMDMSPVNTYVAPGSYCVSACSAIVFMAGKEHIAVPGSRLGFHGCFDQNTKDINNLCNEMIADHAYAHGTAYGSVMAFIEHIPFSEVVWMDGADADCWGINRYQISPPPAGYLQCVRDIFSNPARR